MKQVIKTHVGNFHLYILTGLILVFFGVLFLSTAFKDVKIDYSFEEIITVSDLDDLTLGNIVLTNSGPITAKVQLKNLVACSDKTNVDIEFAGKTLERYGYYGEKTLEISPKDTEEIQILLNYYTYKYDDNGDKEKISSLDLYVYELEKDVYTYGHCNSALKSDAFANIKIIIKEKTNEKSGEKLEGNSEELLE
jgi:hypothetical protein